MNFYKEQLKVQMIVEYAIFFNISVAIVFQFMDYQDEIYLIICDQKLIQRFYDLIRQVPELEEVVALDFQDHQPKYCKEDIVCKMIALTLKRRQINELYILMKQKIRICHYFQKVKSKMGLELWKTLSDLSITYQDVEYTYCYQSLFYDKNEIPNLQVLDDFKIENDQIQMNFSKKLKKQLKRNKLPLKQFHAPHSEPLQCKNNKNTNLLRKIKLLNYKINSIISHNFKSISVQLMNWNNPNQQNYNNLIINYKNNKNNKIKNNNNNKKNNKQKNNYNNKQKKLKNKINNSHNHINNYHNSQNNNKYEEQQQQYNKTQQQQQSTEYSQQQLPEQPQQQLNKMTQLSVKTQLLFNIYWTYIYRNKLIYPEIIENLYIPQNYNKYKIQIHQCQSLFVIFITDPRLQTLNNQLQITSTDQQKEISSLDTNLLVELSKDIVCYNKIIFSVLQNIKQNLSQIKFFFSPMLYRQNIQSIIEKQKVFNPESLYFKAIEELKEIMKMEENHQQYRKQFEISFLKSQDQIHQNKMQLLKEVKRLIEYMIDIHIPFPELILFLDCQYDVKVQRFFIVKSEDLVSILEQEYNHCIKQMLNEYLEQRDMEIVGLIALKRLPFQKVLHQFEDLYYEKTILRMIDLIENNKDILRPQLMAIMNTDYVKGLLFKLDNCSQRCEVLVNSNSFALYKKLYNLYIWTN